ncbi:MAG: hypothetical protein ACXWLM_06440, partial [Myxococcales bacterium]
MKPAASLADYLADPFGRFLAGRTWAHFFVDRGLCGLVLWGRPDVEQVRQMVAAIDAEGRAGVHQSIIDARRLTGVDAAAFEEFSRLMTTLGARLGPDVTHHAIVRPHGFVGATVSGFYSVTPTSFPDRIKVFGNIGAALRWLGYRGDAGVYMGGADSRVNRTLINADGNSRLRNVLRQGVLAP